MLDIQCLPATPENIARATEFLERHWDHERTLVRYYVKAIEEVAGAAHIFVAEENHVTSGICVITDTGHSPVRYEAGPLVVAEQRRGRGVSMALLEAAEDWARAQPYVA